MYHYNFFIVGIGGSAGGIQPLKALIESIPADSDAAFVIIQHLHPGFRSRLDTILSKHANLPVVRADGFHAVRPGVIYVLAENKMLTFKQGCLIARDRLAEEKVNYAIDIFFKSLAQEARNKAIAIVLSGANADGSEGAKCISENGGTVFVQDPMTADHQQMPESVIEKDSPEDILPPEFLMTAVLDKLGYKKTFV